MGSKIVLFAGDTKHISIRGKYEQPLV